MLRFAIIGTGFMGETHAQCLSSLENAELTAVVSRNPEKGRDFAERYEANLYSDYSELLKDDGVDVIDICLPTFLHERAVVEAAAMGKHVFCEKPVALSMESLHRMVDAVNRGGGRFAVGQVVRFWPENRVIKGMYDRGEFGRVDTVYAGRLATHPSWSDWFRDPEKSGGGLFDMHIHDTDFLCHTFGRVRTVFAQGAKNNRGCWNRVSSSLGFSSGVRAVVESSIEMPRSFPMTTRLRVDGEKRSVEYTMRAGENLEDVGSAHRVTYDYPQQGSPKCLEIPKADAYQEELAYFTQSLEEGTEMNLLSHRSIQESLQVICAVKESLETGRVVSL